jgi:hypothetical protein
VFHLAKLWVDSTLRTGTIEIRYMCLVKTFVRSDRRLGVWYLSLQWALSGPTCCFSSNLRRIIIVKAETVLRRLCREFRAYRRWRSSRRGGRLRIDYEVRDLIRRLSQENPFWRAPHIHGELLMLGVAVSESTFARYTIWMRHASAQGWKTFLRNHSAGIASIDL